MQWGWKGNEDIADKSGVLTFEFSAGKARFEQATAQIALFGA